MTMGVTGFMQLLQARDMPSKIKCYLLKYTLFQYLCLPKNLVVRYQRCYFLSSLTHLGVNARKLKQEFWTLVLWSSFYLNPKCIQCIAKTKELALLFQYFLRGLYIKPFHVPYNVSVLTLLVFKCPVQSPVIFKLHVLNQWKQILWYEACFILLRFLIEF